MMDFYFHLAALSTCRHLFILSLHSLINTSLPCVSTLKQVLSCMSACLSLWSLQSTESVLSDLFIENMQHYCWLCKVELTGEALCSHHTLCKLQLTHGLLIIIWMGTLDYKCVTDTLTKARPIWDFWGQCRYQ